MGPWKVSICSPVSEGVTGRLMHPAASKRKRITHDLKRFMYGICTMDINTLSGSVWLRKEVRERTLKVGCMRREKRGENLIYRVLELVAAVVV